MGLINQYHIKLIYEQHFVFNVSGSTNCITIALNYSVLIGTTWNASRDETFGLYRFF
jgi:hypothetical protein